MFFFSLNCSNNLLLSTDFAHIRLWQCRTNQHHYYAIIHQHAALSKSSMLQWISLYSTLYFVLAVQYVCKFLAYTAVSRR